MPETLDIRNGCALAHFFPFNFPPFYAFKIIVLSLSVVGDASRVEEYGFLIKHHIHIHMTKFEMFNIDCTLLRLSQTVSFTFCLIPLLFHTFIVVL